MRDLKISIESASIKDATSILNIQKKAYQTEAEIYQDWNIPPLTQTLDELITEFQTLCILKAVISKQDDHVKIVGSVRAIEDGDIIQIGRLMVEPKLQGLGIGTKLLDAIERIYPERRLELFTGHLSLDNLKLYKKLGYVIFKEQQIHPNLNFIHLYKVSPYKES